jgi:hypothetical protein
MRHESRARRCALASGIAWYLFCCVPVAHAGDEKAQTVKLETQKIALFKNGMGFVIAQGELPRGAQAVRIGQLPVPTFGTFWVSYPKDVKLQNLVTSMEEVEREDPVQSIGHLLLMNVGRKVLVRAGDRDIEGTILPGAAAKGTPESTSPYFMTTRPPGDPNDPFGSSSSPGNLLLIKTDKGIVALNPASILRADFADGEPVTTARHRQKRPGISMQLETPAGGEKITVSYLARGVTWVPSYMVDLSDPKHATFSAHATIVNEMMDLNNVKAQLVTGFPNIRFGGILDPVAKSQSLAEFLQGLITSGGRQDVGDNRMMQQAVLVNSPALYGRDESSIVPGYSAPSEGEVAEDLYFYPVKNLTLKQNETAWIPLFTAEMPYKHVYTWKIRDFVDNEDHYRAAQESQDRKPGEEVWHSCRLTNVLSMPLTTAATEFVTNGEFTGQDVCYYTAPGAETTIKISKALNLLADQGETEVERKRDATQIHGYHYDLVKVRGELSVRNKLARQVNLEITKELSGEVLESTPKSIDTKTAAGLKKVNPKHILTWSIDLKPEQEQKIIYQYQVYIRD